MTVRFGYSFWGFLGDRKFEGGKEVSTPDGNAAYSWSILWEAQRRGWLTFLMQRDRDQGYVRQKGQNAFSSFAKHKRWSAYKEAKKADGLFPELDVLLIEWRWPIPGRNCEIDPMDPGYQPDLDRQIELLQHYSETDTKIILWDLDHKITLDDECSWDVDAIFETSVEPRKLHRERTRIEPPIVLEEIMKFPTRYRRPNRKLVYIGSRYERDDVIDEWVRPVSERYPFCVEFWGNWTREPNLTECREMWPLILYNSRITMVDFWEVYSTAIACPILAKRSYMETGFITPRPWEALMFGTIPIGLSGHTGIDQYCYAVAEHPDHMIDIIEWLSKMNVTEYTAVRRANAEMLSHMSVEKFLDKIESVL